MQMPMLKDSTGKKSMSNTFAWISFVWVMGALTLGLFQEVDIHGAVFKFRMIDPTVVLALLVPVFSLYGLRKFQNNYNGFQPLRKSNNIK